MKRSSGILMHISSLPSRYGIGTFGRAAYDFVDFLEESGQKYWQMLPLNPVGYTASPYQSVSTFAGNPYFIDLEMLIEEGLLTEEDCNLDWGNDPQRVDFVKIERHRSNVLYKAYQNTDNSIKRDFYYFCNKNSHWLNDYAIFCAIKRIGNRAWSEWEDKFKFRDPDALAQFEAEHEDIITFEKYVQFLFASQYSLLKDYAQEKNVKFIGDVPIYVAYDSSDVWANRELFMLGDNCLPTDVAGVPPDYFAADGQLWGNPLYDWEKMQISGFAWWIDRMKHTFSYFDVLRIDHFRGLESFYAVPFGEKTARNGRWMQGPGSSIFDAFKRELGDVELIAEDLGLITDEVNALRRGAGLPGMRILQFAFTPWDQSTYLPHYHTTDTVIYTGTHDNNTMQGWFDTIGDEQRNFAIEYGALTEHEGYVWGMVRLMMGSVAELAVAQMQDFLHLGEWARMNTPSTVGNNWMWRAYPEYLYDENMGRRLKRLTEIHGRM